MRAMILGAGLGTRLRPLTHVRPKPLAPIMGTTILDFWIHRLQSMGFGGIAVNAHHLASQISAVLLDNDPPISMRVFEERVLLGTGGGIRNALEYFEGHDFAVVNGDTLCDANLRELMDLHLSSGEPVTLVLHDCPEFNNVAVHGYDRIVGFGQEARKMASEQCDIRLLAFTGIHFMNPSILESMERGVPADILSTYRNLISEGRPVKAIVLPSVLWREMGTIEAYRSLHVECSRWPADILPPLRSGDDLVVHPSCEVSRGVRFGGFVSAGRGCRMLKGAALENTILWNDVVIGEGSFLRDCIVTDGVTLSGAFVGKVLTTDCP